MFDFVADSAPGVREILTVGKPASKCGQSLRPVVVDSPATGHGSATRIARSHPRVVHVGVVPAKCGGSWRCCRTGDDGRHRDHAEEMPVNETIEISPTRCQRPRLAAVVVYRMLPELFTSREEALFDRLRGPTMTKRLAQQAGSGAPAVLDAAARRSPAGVRESSMSNA